MFHRNISLKQGVCLLLYYVIAQYLPDSYSSFLGRQSNAIRVFLCKRIFKRAGNISAINRKVFFGSGCKLEIGDNSGIGARTDIPNDIIIGNNVIFGRDCFVLSRIMNLQMSTLQLLNRGFAHTCKL